MRFTALTAALAMASFTAAEIKATNIGQLIGVTGNNGACQVQATLTRPGGNPVTFLSSGDCGRVQDNASNFEEADGVKVRFSCDVLGGKCGKEFEIEVKAPDGECGKGVTKIAKCNSGFRRGVKRQDLPTNSALQCYENITLGPC